MYKSDDISELAKAMASFQKEMGAIGKNAKNPYFKSKYADIEAVIGATQEPLAEHGLAVIQTPFNEGDKTGIDTMLLHESGQYLGERFSMRCIDDPQKVGVTLTYFRRYGLTAILRLATTDDDGNHGAEVYRQSQTKPNASQATTKVDLANVLDVGDWALPGGKNKGKKLNDIEANELASLYEWAKGLGPNDKKAGWLEEFCERFERMQND